MYRVDMRHAILRDASLFAVIAYDADFSDADLTRARIISPMSHARFARATLSHANLGADPGNQSMGVMRTDASGADLDRKSTRLNSSHSQISYAVFCLKKKKKHVNHAM